MKIIRAIIVIACLFPAVGNASTVYGTGNNSCGGWSKERAARSMTSRYYQMWVLGFISGAGATLEIFNRSAKITDSDAAHAYIDKYCAEHPLETIHVASQMLMVELLRQ